jgi:hypothetical protein
MIPSQAASRVLPTLALPIAIRLVFFTGYGLNIIKADIKATSG